VRQHNDGGGQSEGFDTDEFEPPELPRQTGKQSGDGGAAEDEEQHEGGDSRAAQTSPRAEHHARLDGRDQEAQDLGAGR
jgi:hypothetical protein